MLFWISIDIIAGLITLILIAYDPFHKDWDWDFGQGLVPNYVIYPFVFITWPIWFYIAIRNFILIRFFNRLP